MFFLRSAEWQSQELSPNVSKIILHFFTLNEVVILEKPQGNT